MPSEPVDLRLLPKYIRKELAGIAVETAVTPVVTRPEHGVWHIGADNGRVQLVSVYSRAAAQREGAHNWVRASLSIDGAEPVSIHRLDDVGDAFHAPDDVAAGRPPRPVAVAPWTAPLPVRRALTDLRASQPQDSIATWGSPITVGRIGRRWVLAIDTDRITLRMHWYEFNGIWLHAHQRPHELIVDGVDRSRDIAGGLTRLTSVMTSSTPTRVATGTPSGPAATPTSVQVRGTVVRRT